MSERHPRIPKQTFGPNGERLCRWCKGEVKSPRRTFCSDACVDEAMIRSSPSHLRKKTKERDKGVCAICGTDTEAIRNLYRRLVAFSHSGFKAYARTEKKISKRYGIPDGRMNLILYRTSRDSAEAQIAAMMESAMRNYERNVQARAQSQFPERYRALPHPDADQFLQGRIAMIRSEVIELTDHERHVLAVEKRFRKLCEARRAAMQTDLLNRGFHDVRKNDICNLWQADHILPVVLGGGGCGMENIRTACTPCHKNLTKELARRRSLERRGIDPDAPPEPDPQLTLL